MDSSFRAPQVVVEPKTGTATAAVIYLHGGTGSAEASSVVAFKLRDQCPHVRWILPNASIKAIPALENNKMAAWFRLQRFMPPHYDPAWFTLPQEEEAESFEDMQENTRTIQHIIDEQNARGIPAHRIVLAGFSQGSAQALVSAALLPMKLAGVSSLVGLLPLEQRLSDSIKQTFSDLPVLFREAERDEMVHESWSNHTYHTLNEAGALVSFQKLPGRTHFCEMDKPVVEGFEQWLKMVIP